MKNIAIYALIGLAAGLLIAQFFPSLGKGEVAAGLNDVAVALGKDRPYATFGGVGALVGAIIGAVTGKK